MPASSPTQRAHQLAADLENDLPTLLASGHPRELDDHLRVQIRSSARYLPYQPQLPGDLYRDRLNQFKRVEERMKDRDQKWIFRNRHHAILMETPKDVIEDIITPFGIIGLVALLERSGALVAHFLIQQDDTCSGSDGHTSATSSRKRLSETASVYSSMEKASGKKVVQGDDDSQVSKYIRDPKSRDLDKKRRVLSLDDSCCVITGSRAVSVCHILPSYWTSNEKNRLQAVQLLGDAGSMLLDTEFSHRILVDEVGIFDKEWNMVTMDCSLHNMWSKGYFALKYHSKEIQKAPDEHEIPQYANVSVIFVWMPLHTSVSPADRVDLNAPFPDGEFIKPKEPSPPASKVYRNPDGLPIYSGHTIKVKRHINDVDSFILAIKLQWALIQIYSMAGRGRKPEDWYEADNWYEPET